MQKTLSKITWIEGAIGYKSLASRSGKDVNVIIRNASGQFPPLGADIRQDDSGISVGMVGEEGHAWLSGVAENQKFTVVWGDSQHYSLHLPEHMEKTFSIKTTKSQNDQCTDGFKVSSSFYTEETLVEEDKALLIGNGLKLRLLDENASPYTFNKYAEYADFTSDMLIYEKTYTAELSSIAGPPIEAGPFDTVVLFKINYN